MAKDKKKLPLSVKLSLIQVALYIAFTLKGFLDDFGESKLLPLIIILEVLFVASFVVTLVMSLRAGDKDDVKEVAGTHKRAVKDVKLTLRVVDTISQVISVLLAIVIVIETYTNGTASAFKQAFALLAAAFAVFGAIRAIKKTTKKVKKRVESGKKAEEKKAAIAEKKKK